MCFSLVNTFASCLLSDSCQMKKGKKNVSVSLLLSFKEKQGQLPHTLSLSIVCLKFNLCFSTINLLQPLWTARTISQLWSHDRQQRIHSSQSTRKINQVHPPHPCGHVHLNWCNASEHSRVSPDQTSLGFSSWKELPQHVCCQQTKPRPSSFTASWATTALMLLRFVAPRCTLQRCKKCWVRGTSGGF